MRRVAVLAFGLATALLACQIVAGIERVEKVPPPVADVVAPDAEPDAPVDPCEHKSPPSRPAKSATPGEDDELPPFLLAFRTLSVVPPKGAPAPGYDQDGVCTCETRSPTAFDGGPSCVVGPKTKACDEDGGVDNQIARLLDDYRDLIQLDEAVNVNDEIGQGARTLLFQISKYNGLPNDPSITVGIFGSEGMLQQSPPHAGCDASIMTPFGDRPDGSVWTPTWCGDDTWSIVKETALGENRPPLPVRTGSGWVKDGVLVVEVSDSVQVPFLTTVITLATARVVAKLTPLGEDLKPRDPNTPPRTEKEKRLFSMDDGVFAGRISARDLLAVAGTFDDPLDKQSGKHMCTNTVFFGQIKDRFCEYLDIASSTQRDQNLAYACDAISGGFGFTAFPALDGTYEPRLPNDNECTAGPDDRPVDAGVDVIYACPLPEAGP